MNEIDFKIYLTKQNVNKKVISDHISRLKRIERSLKNCDLDEEYEKDKCTSLSNLFSSKVKHESFQNIMTFPLPIGAYTMSTFKYSIKKYVDYKNNSL